MTNKLQNTNTKSTKQIGDSGEEMAAEHLLEIGYKLVTRNFRTRYGEIDIIAKDGRELIFIEVKKKTSNRYGLPAEMVTKRKQEKIKRMAGVYILENSYKGPWRIDVVAILGTDIEHIKNITS